MTKEIDQHLTAYGRLSKRKIMINNFLGGMAWGFGTVIGATVVVAIMLAVLSQLNYVPVIGDLSKGATQSIEQKSPTIKK